MKEVNNIFIFLTIVIVMMFSSSPILSIFIYIYIYIYTQYPLIILVYLLGYSGFMNVFSCTKKSIVYIYIESALFSSFLVYMRVSF